MGIVQKALAVSMTGVLAAGCVPAFALAEGAQATAAQTAETAGGQAAEAASGSDVGTEQATDSGSESSTSKSKGKTEDKAANTTKKKSTGKAKGKTKKAKKKSTKVKPATRAQLVKNLGKTSKSSKAYKTASTKYKVKKSNQGKKLLKLMKKLRRYHRVEFAMIDIKTGATLASQSGKKIYSASCLKGPYVAAINKYKRAGTSSGTRYLERQTIVYSNNDTYKALHNRYGTSVMHKYAKYAKVSSSYPWWSRYSYVKPSDLAKLWVANYWYFFKETNSRSKYIRGLYTHGTESFIYQTFRGKKRVYAKPGWYPGAFGNVHNDAGIITCKIKVKGKQKSYPYVLCLMSGAYGSERQLRGIVRQLDKVHTEMVKASLQKN